MSKTLLRLLEAIIDEEEDTVDEDKLTLRTTDPRLISEADRFQRFHRKLIQEEENT